jgi:zinc-binding alcohol dehydrogenase family protein
MKAIAYRQCLPTDDPQSFVEIELASPRPGPRDLIVRVHAVAVNPLDTKLRRHAPPSEGQARVLGFDVAGVVVEAGAQVTRFAPGDRVMYAGDRTRAGGNAELHAVDERLVGRMPASLEFPQAAAVSLTAITAWEVLFDRLQLPRDDGADPGTLLVTAGGGGVGSVAIQLAKRIGRARVVATASRPESREHALRMGADVVLDHRRGLFEQLESAGIPWVDRVFSISHTAEHFADLSRCIAPFGRICAIDETGPIDVRLLKARSASLLWHGMFTRSGFKLPQMDEQGRLLDAVSAMIDHGALDVGPVKVFGALSVDALRSAHAAVERGLGMGKPVLTGFGLPA